MSRSAQTFVVSLLFMSGMIIAPACFGAEAVSGRKVIDIGCHAGDGTCYVTLDGASFGSTLGCGPPTNEFRFENADTASGQRSYASFLAAYISGKTVMVLLDGCTGQGSPKLSYYHITG